MKLKELITHTESYLIWKSEYSHAIMDIMCKN